MAKYFIEWPPGQQPRTFIHTPPLNPRGEVVEIGQEEWDKLRSIHPMNWERNGSLIKVTGETVPTSVKSRNYLSLTYLICLIMGIIIGKFL